MPEPTNNPLTNRQYESTLSSLRSDARKIGEALVRMEADAEKLSKGGHPAPAAVAEETITAMRVVLKNLEGAFKVTF